MSYNPYSQGPYSQGPYSQGPYSPYGGYQQHRPQHDPYAAGRSVAAPAIMMTVVAAMSLVLSVLLLVSTVLQLITGELFVLAKISDLPGNEASYIIGRFAVPLALVAAQAAIVGGGVRMKVLQGYNSANTAAILCLIPCLSPFCFVGMPFGIWSWSC